MVDPRLVANLLASLSEGILIIDPDNTIVYCNQNAAELRRVDPREIIGRPLLDCHQPGSHQKVLRIVEKLKAECPSSHSRIVKTGLKSFQISYTAVRDDGGGFLGVAAVSRDVTENLRLQAELERLSITDELTGLFNQRHFFQRLTHEMMRARRQARPLSVIMMDLGGFKAYNDTHGHPAGDKILACVARIFQQATRQGVDSVFRYGGDEFTVLMPEAEAPQAAKTAERLLDAFSKMPEELGLSLGVTELFAVDNEEALLKRCDDALYAAKNSGKNRYLLHQRPQPGVGPQPSSGPGEDARRP